MTLSDGTSETFTYDSNGLMLTSRKSTDANPTTYVWNGNDLVQETAPDGTVTHYNVVSGLLQSFERCGVTYTVHADAKLGHVESVTEPSGNAVFTATYSAWGEQLTCVDNVPGGMPYRYVGSLGVRWDADLGLYCMRHRWYDPKTQEFLSVDPLRSNADLYEYANDSPETFVDPEGLKIKIVGGGTPFEALLSRAADAELRVVGGLVRVVRIGQPSNTLGKFLKKITSLPTTAIFDVLDNSNRFLFAKNVSNPDNPVEHQ